MFFDVAVWGTVGQWVAAFVTGGAFITTLLIIRRDRNNAIREQATMVGTHIEQESPTETTKSPPLLFGYRITVTNYSALQVSEVHGRAEPVSYWRYMYGRVKIHTEINQPSERYAPSLSRSEWNRGRSLEAIQKNTLIQTPFTGSNNPIVMPEQSITFKYQEQISKDFVALAIYFRDSHARRWRLDATTGSLTRVNDGRTTRLLLVSKTILAVTTGIGLDATKLEPTPTPPTPGSDIETTPH